MSSTSKSKSRSKSSRSKRPEKPKPTDLQPVVVADNDGSTNMVAMILGMVTTIIIFFTIFSEPVVNEEYNKDQQQREIAREEAERADTLEEIMIKLTNLKLKKPTSGILEDVNICQQRVDLAREVIERNPSDAQMRETAVCEGLLAQVKLYGLDFTENLGLEASSAKLKAAYTPYLEDTNPKVYSHARVAQLTHRSFEKLKSGSDDVDEMVNLFADTIERFPDDEYVASMLEAHIYVLVDRDPAYSALLSAKLRERHPPGTLSPVMERRMRNIADLNLLTAENFERKYKDRWANGNAGRRDLIETMAKLLKEPQVGMLVIGQASKLAQWLERNSFYEESRTVYQEIAKSSDNGNVYEEYRPAAKQVAISGLTRLGLVGTTISFRGVDSAGKELIDADLKENVVVVVYWSENSERSVSYLAALNKSARTLENKPIVILAVCIDKQLKSDLSVLSQKSRSIRVLERNYGTGLNSLLTDCPPGALPHVLMIGFGGVVEDVNLDPSEVRNKALAMVVNRSR